MEGFIAGRDTVLFSCPRDPLAAVWRVGWGEGCGGGGHSVQTLLGLNRADGRTVEGGRCLTFRTFYSDMAHIQKKYTSHKCMAQSFHNTNVLV